MCKNAKHTRATTPNTKLCKNEKTQRILKAKIKFLEFYFVRIRRANSADNLERLELAKLTSSWQPDQGPVARARLQRT